MKITLFIILMTIVPLLSFAQNTNESGPIPNAKVKPLPESSKGSLQKSSHNWSKTRLHTVLS